MVRARKRVGTEMLGAAVPAVDESMDWLATLRGMACKKSALIEVGA